MAKWRTHTGIVETEIKIETYGEISEVTISSKKMRDGSFVSHDEIMIPLETLKELVNAQ